MEEKLFEEPGRRIKTLAKVLFVLIVVASVVLAIVFGWERGWRGTRFLPEVFFPIIIGGPLFAWVSSLFLFGFGELIENTSDIRSKARNIDKSLEKKD